MCQEYRNNIKYDHGHGGFTKMFHCVDKKVIARNTRTFSLVYFRVNDNL